MNKKIEYYDKVFPLEHLLSAYEDMLSVKKSDALYLEKSIEDEQKRLSYIYECIHIYENEIMKIEKELKSLKDTYFA